MVNEEEKKLEGAVINEKKNSTTPEIVGQSARTIAQLAGIDVRGHTKILVDEIEGVRPNTIAAEKEI